MRPSHLHVANKKDAEKLGPRGTLGPHDIRFLRGRQAQCGYDANDMALIKSISLPLAEKIFRAVNYSGDAHKRC